MAGGASPSEAGHLKCRTRRWWAGQDSNLQPDRYERPALTVELPARDERAPRCIKRKTPTEAIRRSLAKLECVYGPWKLRAPWVRKSDLEGATTLSLDPAAEVPCTRPTRNSWP